MDGSKEVWRDIKGYEGLYQVSNFGRVKALTKRTKTWNGYKTWAEKIIHPIIQRSGYAHVGLWRNQKCKQSRLHRLVAEAFCQNADKENKTIVNHINENKLDNRACNLEWVTCKENTHHGACLVKRGKSISKTRANKSLSVYCYDETGSLIRVFSTCAEANAWLGIPRNNRTIAATCRGEQSTAFGYRWTRQ